MKRILSLIVLLALSTPAIAGAAGDIARNSLYEGHFEDGLAALAPTADSDAEARFGIGFIRFAGAIEHLAQALFRHGFTAPDGGPMVGTPGALPVPVNPNPEPLDYAKVRGIFSGFETDLDLARADFLAAAELGDFKVPIELLKIRLDLDGNGQREASETVSAALVRSFGMPPEQAGDSTIAFDRADAIWFAGYSDVLASWSDFMLAHDFEQMVRTTFHRFFPRAGLPMQDYTASTSTLMLDPQTDNALADVIALIHTLDWPVVEPARLAHVRERLKEVLALSRRNWDAILAETDDDRELVPGPKQTSPVPGQVTDETVAAWRKTLDTAEAILDGKLLVPHWRFRQGFDLKAYFEGAKRTDFVMLLTGYDALPFLRDGPVASADSFADANRVFGDQLWGYAFWFN